MNLFIETLKPKLHSFKESLYLLAQNKLSLLAAIALVLIIPVAAFSPYIVPYPQRHRPALRLRIPHPLPLCRGGMRQNPAGGNPHQPGALCVLPQNWNIGVKMYEKAEQNRD